MMLSKKQKSTLQLIGKLLEECGWEKWFIQSELPGVTLHTLDALYNKGFLYSRESEITGLIYYSAIRPTTDEQLEYWK